MHLVPPQKVGAAGEHPGSEGCSVNLLVFVAMMAFVSELSVIYENCIGGRSHAQGSSGFVQV